MPKTQNRRKKRNTRRTKKKNKNNPSKKRTRVAKGPSSDDVHCCMCGKKIVTKDGLTPGKCLAKNGPLRAHRICQECWWSDFAREGVQHSCPGCVKGLPLNGAPIDANAVIDLTSD
jgi:hypothetical protein